MTTDPARAATDVGPAVLDPAAAAAALADATAVEDRVRRAVLPPWWNYAAIGLLIGLLVGYEAIGESLGWQLQAASLLLMLLALGLMVALVVQQQRRRVNAGVAWGWSKGWKRRPSTGFRVVAGVVGYVPLWVAHYHLVSSGWIVVLAVVVVVDWLVMGLVLRATVRRWHDRTTTARFSTEIQAPVRLRICAALAPIRSMELQALCDRLGVAAPELSTNLSRLEAAGLVDVDVETVVADGRLLSAWVRLTVSGRHDYRAHLAALREVAGL